jgi:peptidyl-prolyl cis-trans isomerase SurA
MRSMMHIPAKRWIHGAIALSMAAASALLWAQQPVEAAPAVRTTTQQGTVLDRVVAVVNGDPILESDIDEEQRFERIQPYTGGGDFPRERALQRIINRTLVFEEAQRQQEVIGVSDGELDKQLATLRNDIPACRQFHCETDAGWQKFLSENGFTAAEFRDRWRQRMELLRFIQMRFQSGVHITDDQIREYYEKTMLPEYQRQNATPPKLEAVSQRIEEVLLQQQVTNLLRDWLTSLRVQGTVRIIQQDEVGR